MCAPIVLVGAAIGAAAKMLGDYQQTKAMEAQIKGSRLQTREMLKSLNYADAASKLEQKQLMGETVAKLSAANMDRIRNMGTLRAAIGDSMLEGQSMDRMLMVTEGDMLREAAGLTENYQRDYATILGKRYGQTASTKSQIDLMNKSEPKMPSYFSRALNVGVGAATGAISAYAGGAAGGLAGGATGAGGAAISAARPVSYSGAAALRNRATGLVAKGVA